MLDQVTYAPGSGLRYCPGCSQHVPVLYFKIYENGTVHEKCNTCEEEIKRGLRKRPAREKGGAHGGPLMLTLARKNEIDAHVKRAINTGSFASLGIKHRFFRDMPVNEARLALSAYADISEKWCKVTKPSCSTSYHFEAYHEGETPTYSGIIPDDLETIRSYIGSRKIALISQEIMENAGYPLKTPRERVWLLFDLYFGLYPEGMLWRGKIREFGSQRCTTRMCYLAGESPVANDKDAAVTAKMLYLKETKAPKRMVEKWIRTT